MSRLLEQKSDWRKPTESRVHGTKLWVPRGSDPKRWVMGGKTRADEPPLRHSLIIDAIRKCRALLALKADWDDDGASPLSPTTVETAIRFLRVADSALAARHNRTLPSPTVSPCHDGSVDLFWKTERYRLLINIQPDPHASDFYGETLSGFKVKGTFPATAFEAHMVPVLLEIISNA